MSIYIGTECIAVVIPGDIAGAQQIIIITALYDIANTGQQVIAIAGRRYFIPIPENCVVTAANLIIIAVYKIGLCVKRITSNDIADTIRKVIAAIRFIGITKRGAARASYQEIATECKGTETNAIPIPPGGVIGCYLTCAKRSFCGAQKKR